MARIFRNTQMGLAAALVVATTAACTRDADFDSSRRDRFDVAGVPEAPDRVPSLLYVARTTAASGDLVSAVRLYRRVHRLAPDNTEALVGLGRTLAALGAHNEAAEVYRTAIRIEEDRTGSARDRADSKYYLDAIQGLGNTLIALDQPNEAITQFEASLNLKEQSRAYNGIGVAHDMLGDHKTAQAYYRTGLALDPRNLGLINNLGLSLAIEGAFDEAIQLLRRAVVDPRATSRHRLNLALAYGLAGKNDEAAEIARIDLDEASVRSNLAYYRTLRALNDSRATLGALGAHRVFKVDRDAPAKGRERRF